MAFDSTNPVAVSDITKKTQYDTVFDNTVASLHKDESTNTFFEGTAELRMNNNTTVTGKESGGTARTLAYIDGANNIKVGDTTNNIQLRGLGPATMSDGLYTGRMPMISHSALITSTGGDGTENFYSNGSWTFLSSAAFNTRDTTLQIRKSATGSYQFRVPTTFDETDMVPIIIPNGNKVTWTYTVTSSPDVNIFMIDCTSSGVVGNLVDNAFHLAIMRLGTA